MEVKSEMSNHLKGLDVCDSSLEELEWIINTIFDSNDGKVYVDGLLIDYGDRISVNMNDEGKRELMRDIEEKFSSDSIKISEVMRFNNMEFTFAKI